MTYIVLWLLSHKYPPLTLSGLHPPWAAECHQQCAVTPVLKEIQEVAMVGIFSFTSPKRRAFPHWPLFLSVPHLKCFLLASAFASLNPTGPAQIPSPSWNPSWSSSGSSNCSLGWTPGQRVADATWHFGYFSLYCSLFYLIYLFVLLEK